jgi:hypothetical protein
MSSRQLVLCLPAFLILVLAATPAFAQGDSESVGQPLGAIYVSGDASAYVPSLTLAAGGSATAYVIAEIDYADLGVPSENEFNGLFAWEAGLQLPPEVVVLSTVLNPTGAINLAGPPNFIVGTGELLLAENSPVLLATLTLFSATEVQEAPISLVPVPDPSIPDALTWAEENAVGNECFTPTGPTGCVRAFATSGGLVINESPVDTEESSFGALKAGILGQD